jgi:diguanylate cyclase (GGDEF)-like protein
VGLLHIVLGFLALFFIAVLVQAGSVIHAASLRTLIVGFRNEALSTFLAEEKSKQEELTHQLQKAHDQLHKISLTDDLTGLWNRRYLNTTIQEDVAQVLRNYRNLHQGQQINTNETDIVFIMVDLDHFKAVNDSYGHAAGDKVLIQMSQLLTKACRDTDTVIRWGGEEFLVVSRNAYREKYTILVERIRQAVETHQFDIGKESPLHLTCSIGAAAFPFLRNCTEVLSWGRVVGLADTCLYAAKRSGRNAWVGIIPTELAFREDITPDLPKQLPKLIQEGKLDMKTSLKENGAVCWAD